jgi:Cys-tRNA(Pro)/Cys-tRNA(Cys) deacylase
MEKLKSLLNESGFDYEIIKHERKIYSAQDGAEYFGIEIGQTAPTLILSTDNGLIALIISGSKGKMDFDKLGDELGYTINGLADKKDIKKSLGFNAGAIPLVGHELPTIIDSELYKYEYIYGGTGDDDYTLKISPEAVAQLNDIIAEI